MSATATATTESAATTGRRAVVFPGQGSQRPGMAIPWRGHRAYHHWAQADDLLGRDITSLGTDASADELRDPVNCQVALYVHHAVLHEAWREAGGAADVVAGHSLGEYNALAAAGVLTFTDGLRLVDRRAAATAAAARANPGGMVACLGGSGDDLRAACEAAGAAVANDNAEGQLVVAGDNAALDTFTALATAARARVIRLEVGAAYHSPAMAPAVALFEPALEAARFRDAEVDVISNVDALPHRRADDWPALLRAQLTAPVRWRETVLWMAAGGTDDVVELGASPVLTGLVKRTAPGVRRSCVITPDDLETT